MAKTLTLEESFEKLDGLVNQLENGDLTLEESFSLYKDGIKLVENCNGILDKVEKKLVILNGEGENDELS